MNNSYLTNQVKSLAYQLGADLVGIANIERFEKAPVKMSPQGLLPTAKSVIVCAIHHPDACIELGGETEPQDIGPYRIQYVMNDKLDVISFKIGRFLDDLGFEAVPVVSSNIWRYREYKELKATFSPDMSHIYAATAAGLGELGWNGLTLSPEYGARNRFVSIVTNAELMPDPLYNGPKICDMCGECIRNCPTDAYRKEVNGTKVIEFEDKKYKFANKNLWRCAWGEHFDLDLNLEIPEKVTEEVLLETVKKHGLRGGEMGVCLKVCVPSNLRVKDPGYTKYYRRLRHVAPNDVPVHRSVIDKVIEVASQNQIDRICFLDEKSLNENSIDLSKYLPDFKSAVLIAVEFEIPKGNKSSGELLDQYKQITDWQHYSPTDKTKDVILNAYKQSAQFLLDFTALDTARELEKQGYSAVVKTSVDCRQLARLSGLNIDSLEENKYVMLEAILCSADFPSANYSNIEAAYNDKDGLAEYIKRLSKEKGSDLFGVAGAERINTLVDQLRKVKEGEEILMAQDKNTRFDNFDPSVSVIKRKLNVPEDYLKGAKSVIILGLHYPATVVERAGKPPAEAVGPYVFAQYETLRLLGQIGLTVAKNLCAMGYKAIFTYDLIGLGSQVGSPRGRQFDTACNSLEAVAAGLGELTYNGNVYTKEYGTNQRFIAVITDADIKESAVNITGKADEYCESCLKCIKSCPVKALNLSSMVELELQGSRVRYIPMDTNRCDWSSKYALCGDDGFKYIGCNINEMPPEKITAEALSEALKKTDPVLKHRPVTSESCIVNCPMAEGRIKLF